MEPAENGFNPFIDDVDAIEDSVVSELDNFPAREKNEFYEPTPPHQLTEEDYEDEMPPASELDFDQEIEKIIAEREQFASLTLPEVTEQAMPEPELDIRPDYMAEADDLLAAFEFDLDPLPEQPEITQSESVEEQAMPAAEVEQIDLDDFDLDAMLAELDSTIEDEPKPAEPAAVEETLSLDDDDWGFLDEDDAAPAAAPAEAEEDLTLAGWDFDEPDELVMPGFEPAEPEDVEEEIDLSDLDLDDDFTPPENPFAMPAEFDDELPSDDETPAGDLDDEPQASPAPVPDDEATPTGGIKAKLAGLLAQIKAELKGDDAPSDGDQADGSPPANPQQDDTSAPRAGGGILSKVLFPITFIMKFFAGLLTKIFGILGAIPVIGKLFQKIAGVGKLMNILGLIIPLALIVGVLYWHGNGKFAVTDDSVAFPDGGKASITVKEVKGNKVSFTIKNEGDVIAEVTPTVIVYGTELSINPLSFFYPKELKTCKGEVTAVPIGKTKELEINCAISGYRKQASGRIEW